MSQYAARLRQQKARFCLGESRSAARNEMRVLIVFFAIAQFAAIESCDASASAEHDGVSGRGVPLHGAAEPRIKIGDAFGHLAEFQRAAGDAPTFHLRVAEKGFHRGLVAMGAAG